MTKLGRLTVAVAMCLAACATTAPSQSTVLGDGSTAYRITCGGFFSGPHDCYDKAGYICLKGYAVVQETDIKPPESSYIYFWQTGAHELVVKCTSG